MTLKRRVVRLEAGAREGDQLVEMPLGDGRTVQMTRAQLQEILASSAGTTFLPVLQDPEFLHSDVAARNTSAVPVCDE